MTKTIVFQVFPDGTEKAIEVEHNFGGFNPLSDDICGVPYVSPRIKDAANHD